MARKRIVKTGSGSTIEEVIPRFITAKTAAGVSDSTIKTDRSHLSDFCRISVAKDAHQKEWAGKKTL